MPNLIKILYVHGLESGPVGTKTIVLNKHPQFHVDAEDMHMSRYNFRKRNSMVRNVIRQQTVPLIGCGIAAVAAIKGVYPRVLFTSIGLYGGAMFHYRHQMFKEGLKASLEQCIDIQVKAIDKYKPDLIIGSSWGGNVTLELLKRNIWNGPTILLCPAYYAYQKYVNYNGNEDELDEFEKKTFDLGLENNNKSKCLIVHGDIDEVVSIDDSRALYEFNKDTFDIKVAKNDNHRLSGLSTTGELCDIVSEYMS